MEKMTGEKMSALKQLIKAKKEKKKKTGKRDKPLLSLTKLEL